MKTNHYFKSSQMTDNFYKSRNLTLVLDTNTSSDKLLLYNSSLSSNPSNRLEVQQLHYSLMKCMQTTNLAPTKKYIQVIKQLKINNNLYIKNQPHYFTPPLNDIFWCTLYSFLKLLTLNHQNDGSIIIIMYEETFYLL